MKLYTEDQVIKLTKAAFESGLNHNTSIFSVEFEKLTTIKLPTDEEIKKQAYKEQYTAQHYAFIKGAKYVIDKIKGGNK